MREICTSGSTGGRWKRAAEERGHGVSVETGHALIPLARVYRVFLARLSTSRYASSWYESGCGDMFSSIPSEIVCPNFSLPFFRRKSLFIRRCCRFTCLQV